MRLQKTIKICLLVTKIYYLTKALTDNRSNHKKTTNQQNDLAKVLKMLWLMYYASNLIVPKPLARLSVTKCMANRLLLFISNICNNKLISILFVAIICSSTAMGSKKQLPIPRFASVKANEVNARSGPNIKSSIDWIFVKKGEPIEIVAEYEQWRQIRDIKGEGGWVHSSVLSGKRSVITIGDKITNLYKNPQKDEKIVAQVHPKVRCQLQKCREEWCKVQCNSEIGWLLRKQLWGIYEKEQV